MKKVTKVFSVMVASVALAAMLSGCGGDKKPAGGDTIKVGGNLEMTGGSASFGISSKNAIELAFKNINDKGGINGKKLELVVADNKSEAAVSYQCHAEAGLSGQGCCPLSAPKPFLGYDSRRRDQ